MGMAAPKMLRHFAAASAPSSIWTMTFSQLVKNLLFGMHLRTCCLQSLKLRALQSNKTRRIAIGLNDRKRSLSSDNMGFAEALVESRVDIR